MFVKHPFISIRRGSFKIMIGLTYRCQCACEYCCSGKYPKIETDELRTEEIYSLVSAIVKLPSLFTVISFFGGEPMLRNDIYQLIEYAQTRGLFVEMDSNGLLFSQDNVARLKKAGLHHVFIRIEGLDAQTHDKLSNFQGCFDKALEAIINCKKAKLSFSVSTVATKDKIYNNQLREIIKMGRSYGAASVRLLYPTLSGKWSNAESQLLNEDEKRHVASLLEPDFVYLESTYSADAKIGRICPSLQKKFFYISPYGEVQLCPFIPLKFGNIRAEKLTGIINKMWQEGIFKENLSKECPMNQPRLRSLYLDPDRVKFNKMQGSV